MFALIIAIIAIALTVYLAVSTLFYGGDALSNGSARAIASSFINQGQQVSGAHSLYKNDNAGQSLAVAGDDAADIVELQKLVDKKYLTSIPAPQKSTYSLEALTALQVGKAVPKALVATGTIPAEVCNIINVQAGGVTADSANSIAYVQGTSETFGCFDDAGVKTVWYRM